MAALVSVKGVGFTDWSLPMLADWECCIYVYFCVILKKRHVKTIEAWLNAFKMTLWFLFFKKSDCARKYRVEGNKEDNNNKKVSQREARLDL